MHTIPQNYNGTWVAALIYNIQQPLSNMAFVCTHILLILTQCLEHFLDVVIGWDPSISAGEGIFCNGSESRLLDCLLYNVTEYPCTGGATITSCLPSGEGATIVFITPITNTPQ